MRHSVYGFIPALLLAALASPAAAAPCTLDGLRWLEGSWSEKSTQTQGVEHWTVAPSGQLLGNSWFLHPGRDGGLIEAMTILPDNDRILLRIRHFNATLTQAEEEKSAPMQFVAANCERNLLALDGEGAQAGEHMTYRRNGSHLMFVGDFLHDGQPVKDEETFVRDNGWW